MEYWIVGGLAAFFLGLSKGGIPTIALLSVPMMALFIDPARAAGLLLPIYIVADAYAIYLFRRSFSVPNLKILVPSALVGIIIGYVSVAHVPASAVKFLLAGVGIGYLINAQIKRFGKRQRPATSPNVPRGVFWGTLAGLTSYIAHAGGPPYQVYILPQRLDKMTYLGTTTILFAIINLMKVPPYILAGQITWSSVVQSAWLAPIALLGAWSGVRLIHLLSERVFYALIEVALGIVSMKLLYEAVLG